MIKEYEISHHSSLIRGNFKFKYDEKDLIKILKNHTELYISNEDNEGKHGGMIDGPDNLSYFIEFLKELFPNKNFVMIQKDEYELSVESTNPELKSEIIKVIKEGPNNSKIQVTDFGFSRETPKLDNDFLKKLFECNEIKDQEDDNWYSEIFEVVN